jgi:hypothetical protein
LGADTAFVLKDILAFDDEKVTELTDSGILA